MLTANRRNAELIGISRADCITGSCRPNVWKWAKMRGGGCHWQPLFCAAGIFRGVSTAGSA